MTSATRLVSFLVGACLLPSLAVAQAVPDPAATAVPAKPSPTPAEVAKKPEPKPATDGSTPVELSPFEVRADDDVGYQAANTTSGSRLNSRLRDTPASVTAFTPEFLSDIAATNLEEMLGHATNIEIEVEDSNAGFNNPPGRGATGNDYQFRMRGSPAGSSRDFVESNVPVDLYNVERAEAASGPNSILFGLGQAGGLVSLTGKKANLTRDRTTLKSMHGSWHYERYEADHNQVLIPKKLGVRLLGLYQNNQGWRYWDFNDQVRYTGAVAYQPFKNTIVHVSAEKGLTDNNLTMGWNATDMITAWLAAGRPVSDATALTGATRLNATNNRYTFNEEDGVVYNLRGELQSAGLPTTPTLLPSSMSPYNFNLTGPGGVRHQTFHTAQAQIQQKLPRGLNVELAYFYNTNDVEANGMAIVGNSGLELRGDPNLTLARPDGAAGTVPNPHAREFYLETQWFKDRVVTSNEIFRFSVAWEVGDSRRWFGRHRLAGLLENSRQDRLRRWRNEILVDDKNVPITNAANAEGAQNQLTRRHYFAEGDFRNYYAGNSSIPMPEFTLSGRRVHAVYASRARANTHTFKDINTAMLASQSFWFKDRLVTTLGTRLDAIDFTNDTEDRILNPNDPRITSGRFALSEWDFNGGTAKNAYKPKTFSAGAVVHATNRISVFYNMSRNNGQPRFEQSVLPFGLVPDPTEGQGRDYGVMVDLLGEDRLFVRATWFETKQLHDAPISPGANALGVDNLAAMLTALQGAGKITQTEFDSYPATWNSATIDIFTKGMEIEAVANPTKNLTLRASYSYSERRRENFFSEVFAFFGEHVPEWRTRLAGTSQLAAFDTAVKDLNDELTFQVNRQNSPFGSRPYKLNGTLRYKFDNQSRLRGAFVGGSLRYSGKNFISWDQTTGYIYWGNENLLGDAFAGYRFRVPRTKINATMQLNVKNISNSYLANVGRYNDDYTGVRRIYLNEPRSYRLTTTLEF
ncbi:MAG TPA: TonB-dependent receptor plug domain-containing protein [Opitutaceae bacterium]|nr:TonB-dependent receptor plug domain-containing protein [Opitutaceae bacterium]